MHATGQLTTILDGKSLAASIREALRERLASIGGDAPRLDILVASHDPASVSYVGMKIKAAEEIGIKTVCHPIDYYTTQEALICLVKLLNGWNDVHGVLIQHPLPAHLDEGAALSILDPEKDVDGISPRSIGLLASGLPGHRSATPLGVIKLLNHYRIPMAGKNALVIGCSVILGKPMALMLLEQEATVFIAHKRTRNLPELCRQADIVISATGASELVRGSWLKPGAVVVDCGFSKIDGRICGDVAYEEAAAVASCITPVPGGVGPMTVATLMSNVIEAYEGARG